MPIWSRSRAPGYELNDDYNGEHQDGFSRMQMTIRNGRRESAATAYLHPVLARKNLDRHRGGAGRARRVRGNARRRRRVSARTASDFVARAEREVIVSAGAINSPQILMLSGIGDPQALGGARHRA